MSEHLYIVTYDIRSQKRWREVFKIMKGFGAWVQLSVFQCRMSRRRKMQLQASLAGVIHQQDHVLIMDLGPAEAVKPKVESLGLMGFEAIERKPTIV